MKISRHWFGALCVCGSFALSAVGEEFVVVSASAAPGYNRAQSDGRGLRPETYTFMEGHYLGGTTRDPGLDKMQFMTIANTLARGLVQQNYFPIKDPQQADLVIVVHWGTTTVYEEPNRQLMVEGLNASLAEFNAVAATTGGIADPGAVNLGMSEMRGSILSQESAMAMNAKLLGYRQAVNRERQRAIPSEEERTMKLELSEERYFVVLMAYDRRTIKKHEKAPVLWATRISIRSPGNNFAEAMPAMVKIASDSFGRNRDGLQRVRASARGANIDLGTPEVVEPVVERIEDVRK